MGKPQKRPRDDAAAAGSADARAEDGAGTHMATPRRKNQSAAGGDPPKKDKRRKAIHRVRGKVIARPPPSYRARAAATNEDSAATVLSPGDVEYEPCVERAYKGFHVDDPEVLPLETHHAVASAFEEMREHGYFHRDVLAAGNTVSPTFVRRVLVGERGMTYHYQKLRIFAHSWDERDLVRENEDESLTPLRVVRGLNEALKKRAARVLKQNRDQRVGNGLYDGSCAFNVALINLMDPADVSQNAGVPLKNETSYGLGPTSVSWHSDSSLQDFSTVAVYHICDDERDQSWHVAFRTLEQPAITPALRVPLPSLSTYYMLRDFNAHHHHAVLAGNSKRYSSTHRVAVVERDTFEYVKRKCAEIIALLPVFKRHALGARNGDPARNRDDPSDERFDLPKLTQRLGEAHREVEFQWIRMFHVQGAEHAARHAHYWRPRIEELTQAWDCMELGLRWVLDCLRFGASEEGPAARSPPPSSRAYDVCAYVFLTVATEREAFEKRCSSRAYARLPEAQRPVMSAPKFEKTSPLPKNVRPVVSSLARWKKQAAAKAERFRAARLRDAETKET